MESNRGEIGRVLASLRKKYGLTGEYISERTGKSQSTISDYERGITAPQAPYINEFLSAIDATQEDRELLQSAFEFFEYEFFKWPFLRDERRPPDYDQIVMNSKACKIFCLASLPAEVTSDRVLREKIGPKLAPSSQRTMTDVFEFRDKKRAFFFDDERRITLIISELVFWMISPLGKEAIDEQVQTLVEIGATTPKPIRLYFLPLEATPIGIASDFVIADDRIALTRAGGKWHFAWDAQTVKSFGMQFSELRDRCAPNLLVGGMFGLGDRIMSAIEARKTKTWISN